MKAIIFVFLILILKCYAIYQNLYWILYNENNYHNTSVKNDMMCPNTPSLKAMKSAAKFLHTTELIKRSAWNHTHS